MNRRPQPPHEPFAEGNGAALRHGVFSERAWAPLIDPLIERTIHDAPWTGRPAFRDALESWAVASVQARLCDDYLAEVGILTAKGGARAATLLSDRLHTRASRLREQLGLTPSSMAKLLADFGSLNSGGEDVLAQLRAEGAATLAARPVPLGAGDDEAAS